MSGYSDNYSMLLEKFSPTKQAVSPYNLATATNTSLSYMTMTAIASSPNQYATAQPWNYFVLGEIIYRNVK